MCLCAICVDAVIGHFRSCGIAHCADLVLCESPVPIPDELPPGFVELRVTHVGICGAAAAARARRCGRRWLLMALALTHECARELLSPCVWCVELLGSDVHYWKHGRIGDFVLNAPMIIGHEAAGVVVRVAAGCDALSVGDRVGACRRQRRRCCERFLC